MQRRLALADEQTEVQIMEDALVTGPLSGLSIRQLAERAQNRTA
jgi:hypothetical protein